MRVGDTHFAELQRRYDEFQMYKHDIRRKVRDKYKSIINDEINDKIENRRYELARDIVEARRNGAQRQVLAEVIRTNSNKAWQEWMDVGGWDSARQPRNPSNEFFAVLDGLSYPIRIKALAVPGWGELREGDVEFTLRARKHIRTSGRVDKRWDFDPKAFDFDDTPEFEKAWGANFAEAVAELQEFGWSLGVDWDDYYEKQGGDENNA